jgi:hypothetical protein
MTPVYIGERSSPLRMMSWVRSLVSVIQHGSCFGCWAALPRKEKTGSGSSECCSSITEKSMVLPSRRGGVPVFRRPCGSFSSFSRAASETEGGSPIRPPV